MSALYTRMIFLLKCHSLLKSCISPSRTRGGWPSKSPDAFARHRPIRRGTLAEQLARAVAEPKSRERYKLRHVAGEAVKYALGGAIFVLGATFVLGGRERMKQDLSKLSVRRPGHA